MLKQTNSYLMFMKITQIKIYLEYELGVNCFVNQTKRKMNYVTPIYYSRNNYFDSTKVLSVICGKCNNSIFNIIQKNVNTLPNFI